MYVTCFVTVFGWLRNVLLVYLLFALQQPVLTRSRSERSFVSPRSVRRCGRALNGAMHARVLLLIFTLAGNAGDGPTCRVDVYEARGASGDFPKARETRRNRGMGEGAL